MENKKIEENGFSVLSEKELDAINGGGWLKDLGAAIVFGLTYAAGVVVYIGGDENIGSQAGLLAASVTDGLGLTTGATERVSSGKASK